MMMNFYLEKTGSVYCYIPFIFIGIEGMIEYIQIL